MHVLDGSWVAISGVIKVHGCYKWGYKSCDTV